MQPKSTLPNDSKEAQDAKYDPAAERADELFNHPEMLALNDQLDAIDRDDPQSMQKKDSEALDAKKLRSQEENPDKNFAPDGFWNGDGTPQRVKGSISRLRNNRKALIGLGAGGGVVVLLVSAFFALLPLKLEMLIKSATSQAADIPESMIEHRIQYLTNVYIARKIVGASVGTNDIAVGNGIAKDLFTTWQSSNYQKQLGFTIHSDRLKPGETGFHWQLYDLNNKPLQIDGKTIEGQGVVGATEEKDIINSLDGRSEFRTYIKAKAREATKWYQFYKRWAMRKTLARVFGVGKWAWLPDPATEKLDNYGEKFRAFERDLRGNLYKNTVGRVAPRSTADLACLTDDDACTALKDNNYSDTEIKAQQAPPCDKGDSSCQGDSSKFQESQTETSDSVTAIEKEAADGEAKAVASESSKFISKQLLAKVAGGWGILDTLARAVNAIDKGALSQVQYDRNSIAYVGYASEWLSINDQWKAGQLTGDAFDAAMSWIGDYGDSPVYQQLVGVTGDVSNKQFERNCGADQVKTLLPKGETMCPDRKVIVDKATFTSQSWWQSLESFASVYLNTAGKLLGAFNSIVGSLTKTLGIDSLIAKALSVSGAGDLLAKGMNLMLGIIYSVAITGQETKGDAGDQIIGGIDTSYFALGQSGQDSSANGDGGGLGLGGAITSPEQTSILKSQIAKEKQDENDKQPLLARLFNTSNDNSLVSQLAIRMPTNMSQLSSVPAMLSTSFANIFNPGLSAATHQKNAFGIDMSYTLSNSDLEQDPDIFTGDTCLAMDKAREDSYTKLPQYPIKVYTKSDPCAMEKVAVASAESQFISGTPKGFSLVGNQSSNPSNPGGSNPGGNPGGGVDGDDYAKECKPGGGLACDGQCVDFVKFRLKKHIDPNLFGSLGAGADVAAGLGRDYGYAVNNQPAVHSVVSFPRGGTGTEGGGGDPEFGHTAMVAQVNADGTIVIEEYNYLNPLHYDSRTIPKETVHLLTYAHTETKYN